MTAIMIVTVVVVSAAALVGLYYLVLWARHDARSERAASKMRSQVERMQLRRARISSGTGQVPVPSGSWAPELNPRPGFAVQVRSAAPASQTRGNAGNGVVTTDIATTRAAVDGTLPGDRGVLRSGCRPSPYPRNQLGVPRRARLSPDAVGFRVYVYPEATPRTA